MTRPKTLAISRALLRRAARLLSDEASALKKCSTVAGKWEVMTPSDAITKRDYDRMKRCADALWRLEATNRGENK